MYNLSLQINERSLPKLINFLMSLPQQDVKVVEHQDSRLLSYAFARTSADDEANTDDIHELSTMDYLNYDKGVMDKAWLDNLFVMMDNAFEQSELVGVQKVERDWTRDELYER